MLDARWKNPVSSIQYIVIVNACNRLVEVGIIFLIVFTPIYYGSVTLGATTIIKLTILLMMLIWAIGMMAQGGLMFRRTPLDIAILLFCVYSAISTMFFSKYTYISHIGLSSVLCISALYFIVVNHIRSRTQLLRLFLVILVVGFAHAFSHLIQNAAGLFGVSTGVMFNVGNHFAGYMVIIIPLAVATSFAVKDTGKRVLLIFASTVMAAAMVFSLIAGAMLTFLLSLVLIALLFVGSESRRAGKPESRKTGCLAFRLSGFPLLHLGGIVLCLLLVVLWFGYTPVIKELLSLTNLKTGSPAGRLSLWKSSLAMFADNPITGTGLGTFDYIYPKYRLSDMYGRAVYAHSDWLQLLAELGVIGFAIFLFGVLSSFMLIRRGFPAMKTGEDWTEGLIVGGLSSIGAGLAHALVEFNFHIPAIAVLFTVIVGLTVAASSGYTAYGESESVRARKRGNVYLPPRSLVPLLPRPLPLFARISIFICLTLIVGFSAVLILRPYLADTYYRNGIKLEEELLWDEAVAEYQSALRISHDNSDYFYALGNVHAKRASLTGGAGTQEKWAKLALNAYHQAIELCPTYGDYYLVLGNLHEVVGSKKDAEAAYLKAISFDPNNAFYHRTYGSFCLKQSETQKAIPEYKKALAVYPIDLYDIVNECYVVLDTGVERPTLSTHAYAGGYQASSQHPALSIAQRIRPQDVRSHATLARFCVSKGWHDAAFSEYQKAIALAPGQLDLYEQLSSLLVRQGELQEAVTLWRQFLPSHSATRDPQNAQTHAQLAAVYIKQERLDDAIQQYLTAANIDPGNSDYLIRAADLYMQKDESGEAVRIWQTLIKQSPDTAAAAYYRLGKYHEHQVHDWISAIHFFQQAVAADPRNLEYRLHLAQSYYAKELFYEAIQEWKRALNFLALGDPRNVPIHLQLARVYQRIDAQDKAREHYCQVLRLQPENVEAQRALNSDQ